MIDDIIPDAATKSFGDRIIRFWNYCQQNNPKPVTTENDEEIRKEYISTRKAKTIDNLILNIIV